MKLYLYVWLYGYILFGALLLHAFLSFYAFFFSLFIATLKGNSNFSFMFTATAATAAAAAVGLPLLAVRSGPLRHGYLQRKIFNLLPIQFERRFLTFFRFKRNIGPARAVSKIYRY